MTPYIGEIIAVGFNFAPVDWALCNGQLLPISQYDALYNLIGTTYGGDGINTFGLPNLQGYVAIGQGEGPGLNNYVIGQTVGLPAVQLTGAQIPSHAHDATVSTDPATLYSPATTTNLEVAPASSPREVYGAATEGDNFGPNAIGAAGGSQSHDNFQPYLVINFAIALFGIFPTQS